MTNDDEDREERLAFAARLTHARKRVFPKTGEAIDMLKTRYGIKRRTYFSHESGERLPKDAAIMQYAELFQVTPEYLRYGTGAENFEEADEGEPTDEPEDEALQVNQLTRQDNFNPSHNTSIRFIVLLSADDIRAISLEKGNPTEMSGARIPLPAFTQAGPQTFAYILPERDTAMVASDGPSFRPGTCLLIDPDRTIMPGDFVLADLKDYELPLLRRYKAARSYAQGVRFTLEALNPAYETITVDSPKDCLKIGRLILTQQEY